MNTKARPAVEPVAASSHWERIAAMPRFRALTRSRLRFIVPATVFFLVYYFALPVLTGWMPELMGRKLFGSTSLAYLFALSQFPMAWIVAALYLRAAARYDRAARQVLADAGFGASQEDDQR